MRKEWERPGILWLLSLQAAQRFLGIYMFWAAQEPWASSRRAFQVNTTSPSLACLKFQLFRFCIYLFIYFGGTGVHTQGLHFEPLHPPFFVMDIFQDRVLRTICPGWLQTMILLISAS
jgi:hypothetical protein